MLMFNLRFNVVSLYTNAYIFSVGPTATSAGISPSVGNMLTPTTAGSGAVIQAPSSLTDKSNVGPCFKLTSISS